MTAEAWQLASAAAFMLITLACCGYIICVLAGK